jgi:hypothetical protein
MNMQDLVTWIGAASGSASLVTLVYLSIQIRQNNMLMRAGARQAQVETDQDHIRTKGTEVINPAPPLWVFLLAGRWQTG